MPRPPEFSVANYKDQTVTPLQPTAQPILENADGSGSTVSTAPLPVETEFLTDLEVGSAQNGTFNFEGLDWESLMNDGQLWNSIGGGWTNGVLDEDMWLS
jgi:hypothetical protein